MYVVGNPVTYCDPSGHDGEVNNDPDGREHDYPWNNDNHDSVPDHYTDSEDSDSGGSGTGGGFPSDGTEGTTAGSGHGSGGRGERSWGWRDWGMFAYGAADSYVDSLTSFTLTGVVFNCYEEITSDEDEKGLDDPYTAGRETYSAVELVAGLVVGGGSIAVSLRKIVSTAEKGVVIAAKEGAVIVAEEGGVFNIIQTTVHGAERIAGSGATRGGVLSVEQVSQVLKLGKTMTQADGAIVKILETSSGRFDVVIKGEKGIITTFQNISEKSLGRLSKNYGWY